MGGAGGRRGGGGVELNTEEGLFLIITFEQNKNNLFLTSNTRGLCVTDTMFDVVHVFGFINYVDKVTWPPSRDSSADVSSVSPSS